MSNNGDFNIIRLQHEGILRKLQTRAPFCYLVSGSACILFASRRTNSALMRLVPYGHLLVWSLNDEDCAV